MPFLNPNLKILLIGDVIIDHYIHGRCDKISPEGPIRIVDILTETYQLGGAGKVLTNLISLGYKPVFLTLTGEDALGKSVKNQLENIDIPVNGVFIDKSRSTTVKSRIIAEKNQLLRIDKEDTSSLDALMEPKILDYFKSIVDLYDIVLISDYDKGMLTDSLYRQIIAESRNRGIQVLVDMGKGALQKCHGATTIKVNKENAFAATGLEFTSLNDLRKVCETIFEVTMCDNVIITLGDAGIAYYNGTQVNVIRAETIELYDKTGVRDAVFASIAASLGSGWSLENACIVANRTATAMLTKRVNPMTIALEETVKS